jgi:hypothetical protein
VAPVAMIVMCTLTQSMVCSAGVQEQLAGACAGCVDPPLSEQEASLCDELEAPCASDTER